MLHGVVEAGQGLYGQVPVAVREVKEDHVVVVQRFIFYSVIVTVKASS